LRRNETITVLGLAPEDDCMTEIVVLTRIKGRAIGVPLAQLTVDNCDAETAAAVSDWQYWVAMGYQY